MKSGGKTPGDNITPTISQVPVSPTPTEVPNPTQTGCEALKVTNPEPNAKISSPLQVKAIIDNSKSGCHWTVFEAQAGTIELKDQSGLTLGNGVLKTTEDWTNPGPVNYSGQIVFTKTSSSRGMLIITEENPSGKPDPKVLVIPVNF